MTFREMKRLSLYEYYVLYADTIEKNKSINQFED